MDEWTDARVRGKPRGRQFANAINRSEQHKVPMASLTQLAVRGWRA